MKRRPARRAGPHTPRRRRPSDNLMHVHCEHPLWAYTSRCDNTTVRVVQPREQVHRGRIVLVINSFEGSRAVERAVAHGFGSEDTLVVSGGASAESLVRTEHCIHYKVVHNSIDFTGLITVVERLPNIVRAMGTFDAFFYSHDTVEFGQAFRSRVLSFDLQSSLRLLPSVSMNMGVYRMSELQQCAHVLRQWRSRDHPTQNDLRTLKAFGVYWEDGVFACMRTAHAMTSQERCVRSQLPARVYNGTALRIAEHYLDLDLVKFKANWRAPNATPGARAPRSSSWVLGS